MLTVVQEICESAIILIISHVYANITRGEELKEFLCHLCMKISFSFRYWSIYYFSQCCAIHPFQAV
jgi:hypothetical protein